MVAPFRNSVLGIYRPVYAYTGKYDKQAYARLTVVLVPNALQSAVSLASPRQPHYCLPMTSMTGMTATLLPAHDIHDRHDSHITAGQTSSQAITDLQSVDAAINVACGSL